MTDTTLAGVGAAVPVAASPLATGDYGGRYQDLVGGWFLAQLLMGTPIAGVPGTVSRLGYQRRTHDALLDDIVIETVTGPTVEFSIKAGIKITASDPDLRETLTSAWTRAQGGAEHWSGLVAPPNATGIAALALLLFHVHQHEQVADFMRAITTPGVIAAADRRRFDACRSVLDAADGGPINDGQFHAFLRKFVLLQLDFAIPPHRDFDTVVATLSAVQGITPDEARSLFARLVTIGEEAVIASAAWERPALVAQLQSEHIAAGVAGDFRAPITALAEYAERTFESRTDAVAGVHLDRHLIVDAITGALANGKSVLLTGPSGYGKSAVVRSVYGACASDGPVLHLSGRRIAAAGSWPGLADDIGIPRDRARLAEILATNARGATIIFDALEHVQDARTRMIVNDLLRDMRARVERLNVVIATRDLLVTDVMQWIDVATLSPVESVTLGALSTDDAARIAAASEPLGDLIARIGTNRLPGGLVVLRLLHDARIPDAVLAATPATEGDLLDVWWTHVLVGQDVDRHDRRIIVGAAAAEVVRSASGLFRLPLGVAGVAIVSLEVDGVLLVDEGTDRYRFGHDIIQDWAVVRWLDSEPDTALANLTTLVQAPGFYRCVALFAQRLAERDAPRYDSLFTALEAAHDQRAQHAFLSALALSPQAQRLLAAHETALLEAGGSRLAALLTVLSVEQIDANVELLDRAVRTGIDIATATTYAIANGMPRHIVWAPALRFCITHLESLGRAAEPFLTMAEAWQKTTPVGTPLRDRLFAGTMRILAALEPWQTREADVLPIAIAYPDTDAAATTARSAVAYAADVDPAAVARYLDDVRANGYSHAQDDVLALAGVLGAALTAEVVAFTVALLTEREPMHQGEHDFSEFGLRAHTYFPPSDAQGPFLALLRANETAGLAVVRQLVARAADRYQRQAARGSHGAHWRPLTFTFRGRTITVRGDERAYNWFRPAAHDSNVLTSALMALDTWALEAVQGGRDVLEIADLLLSQTDAAAFLGIVVGLAYDVPALVPELVDLVAHPWLWRFERGRALLDAQPTDYNAILPAEFRLPAYRPELTARNRHRDAARTQQRVPVNFAVQYLFGGDAGRCEQFLARAGQMALTDACLWVEEQPVAGDSENAREIFDQFRSFTNPADYEITENRIQWRPPAALLPSAEEQRTQTVRQAMIGADLVAAAALHDYAPPPNAARFDAVGQSVEAELLAGRFAGEDLRYARQSILRCAGVSVTFGAEFGAPPSAWAIGVIRASAATELARQWSPAEDDEDALDARIGIATALGALFAANPEDDELRALVFRSAALAPMNVGASLLRGLTPAWATRPLVPLNLLRLLVDGALHQDTEPLADADVEAYIADDRAERAGQLANMLACSKAALHRIGRVLAAAKPTFERPETLDALVPIAEQCLALLQSGEVDEDEAFSLSLTLAIAHFCAAVFAALPATGHERFRAGFCNWMASPDFYGEALIAVIRNSIGYMDLSDAAIARFEELANPFLEADHRVELSREHLHGSFQKACWALVMTEGYTGVIVLASWPHARRFADHLSRWTSAVGGHPTTVNALIPFLDRFATAFTPAQIVGWIATCAAGAATRNQREFWRHNGDAIATLLLRLLTDRPQDFREAELRRGTGQLADHLVSAGIAAGGELRRAVEGVAID